MSRLAKLCSQLLSLAPERTVALALADEGLAGTLRSLAGSAGAVVLEPGPEADEADAADAGVVELEALPAPLVPSHARALVDRVRSGGPIVVVIRAAGEVHPNRVAARIGPLLKLLEVHAEAVDGAVVLRGTRRPRLGRARQKELRGVAHPLEATVLIGRGGLSEETVAAAREAIERHGLIKAKLTPQSDLDKDTASEDLAWAIGADLVQRIGKTMVLWRPDVTLAPPVSRKRRQ